MHCENVKDTWETLERLYVRRWKTEETEASSIEKAI
jgi:hypothetical protein